MQQLTEEVQQIGQHAVSWLMWMQGEPGQVAGGKCEVPKRALGMMYWLDQRNESRLAAGHCVQVVTGQLVEAVRQWTVQAVKKKPAELCQLVVQHVQADDRQEHVPGCSRQALTGEKLTVAEEWPDISALEL